MSKAAPARSSPGKFDARARAWRRGFINVVVNASARREEKTRARKSGAARRGEIPHAAPPKKAALALREIAAMLDELPEDQRSALLMKADGMASSEIARCLGSSERRSRAASRSRAPTAPPKEDGMNPENDRFDALLEATAHVAPRADFTARVMDAVHIPVGSDPNLDFSRSFRGSRSFA